MGNLITSCLRRNGPITVPHIVGAVVVEAVAITLLVLGILAVLAACGHPMGSLIGSLKLGGGIGLMIAGTLVTALVITILARKQYGQRKLSHVSTVEDTPPYDLQKAVEFLDHFKAPPPIIQEQPSTGLLRRRILHQPSPEEQKAHQLRSVVEKEILTIFKEKLSGEPSLAAKELFCHFFESTIEFKMIFLTQGQLECWGTFRGDNGFIRSKDGHYPHHDYLTILLPWPNQGEPLAHRVETLWKSFNKALMWWQGVKSMIEMNCYEGTECKVITSQTIVEAKFFVESVEITIDQEGMSAHFYPNMKVKLKNSEQDMDLRCTPFTLTDSTELSAENFQSTIRTKFMESFDQEAEDWGKWPDFSKFFLTTQETAASSPEGIEKLDQLLNLEGKLIDAYGAENKKEGLALMTPSLIRKTCLKIHPDHASRHGLSKEEQTGKFNEFTELVTSAQTFFQSL